MHLAPDRKRAVGLRSRRARHALGNFALDHQDEKGKMLAQLEEAKQNGGGDAVREIRHELDLSVGQNFFQRKLENISLNQLQRGMRSQRAAAQLLDQKPVDLDGPDAARALDQTPGQRTETGSDL